MFIGITRVRNSITGEFTKHIAKVWIETNRETVARNLSAESDVEYYVIKLDDQGASLEAAALKTGARRIAPAREVIEVEADGVVVASVEVDV